MCAVVRLSVAMCLIIIVYIIITSGSVKQAVGCTVSNDAEKRKETAMTKIAIQFLQCIYYICERITSCHHHHNLNFQVQL